MSEASAVIPAQAGIQKNESLEGWQFLPIKDFAHTTSGGTPKRGVAEYYNGDVPWVKSGDLNDGHLNKVDEYITELGLEKSSAKLFKPGTLLIALYGATIGRLSILNFEASTNQAVCGISVPENVDVKYLFYYLLSIRQKLIDQGKGGAQPNINQQIVKQTVVPLAPPEQQKRIVAKIEELFSHIDAGIEALKKAKQLLKQYRQSVLKAAVTGELTKEWREKGDGADIGRLTDHISKHIGKGFTKYQMVEGKKGWIKVVLKDISSRVSVGHVGKTSEFYCDESDGVPFLRSQNIRPGKVVFEGTKYITKEFHDSLKKSQLQEGDLLIVRVGANRGDAAVMPVFKGDVNCANIVFARTPKELSGYLDVYYQSKLWTDLVDSLTTGSAQGVINTKTVEKVELDIPPLMEMEKILEIVEEKSTGVGRLESELDSQLIKADISKQSVLASAFSGQI